MDPDLLIPVQLAKDGFGNAQQIRESPSDVVMAAYHYSQFTTDYTETYIELNKESPN